MKSQSQPEWLPKELPKLEEQPRLLLLCGGDLLETFSVPGLWQEKDVSLAMPYNPVLLYEIFCLLLDHHDSQRLWACSHIKRG